MTHKFKIGDEVTWRWRAGRATGKIIKIHTNDITLKGRTYPASPEDPRYEIRSDKSGHTAIHKEQALHKKNN